METEIIKIIGMIISIIIAATSLQRMIRNDYEKKILDVKNHYQLYQTEIEKKIDINRSDINLLRVRSAELNAVLSYIKDALHQMDKKLDRIANSH